MHRATPIYFVFVSACFVGLHLCSGFVTAQDRAPESSSAKEPIDQTFFDRNRPDWNQFYRELHSAPELSFRETETAKKLSDRLRKKEVEVTGEVGRTGIVGVVRNGKGPTLMLRSDLDGLPVTEQTELDYASKVRTQDARGVEVGVMHACAHDIHMTCQIAAVEYLIAHRNSWSGTLLIVGQPAEEIGNGAKAMLADGLFSRFPRPDYAVALHVDSEMQAGKVGYRSGYLMASVDSVDIIVKGKGGHGAFPHKTIDPVVQAAHLILDLQTLISRENSPLEPAVITVGSIHAGTKHNIIDNTCRLQLTVRSYSPEVRKRLLDGIVRKANAAAQSAGADEPEIDFSDATPSTRNDPELVESLVPTFREYLGSENVIETQPVMGGEDFSEFGLAGVPIAMFRLGTIAKPRYELMSQPGGSFPSLHSARFFPDYEQTIETGTKTLVAAAIRLLPKR